MFLHRSAGRGYHTAVALHRAVAILISLVTGPIDLAMPEIRKKCRDLVQNSLPHPRGALSLVARYSVADSVLLKASHAASLVWALPIAQSQTLWKGTGSRRHRSFDENAGALWAAPTRLEAA